MDEAAKIQAAAWATRIVPIALTAYGISWKPVVNGVSTLLRPVNCPAPAADSKSGKLTFLRGKGGVSTLKSGRYTVRVADASKTAGFALTAVKRAAKTLTAPRFTGKRTLTVVLVPGQWFFYSPAVWRGDRFKTIMHGVFSVTWVYVSAVFGAALYFVVSKG